jgi:hypothetical protein
VKTRDDHQPTGQRVQAPPLMRLPTRLHVGSARQSRAPHHNRTR